VPEPEFLFEGDEIPPEFLGEVELPEPLFIPVKPPLPLVDEPTELLPLELFDIPLCILPGLEKSGFSFVLVDTSVCLAGLLRDITVSLPTGLTTVPGPEEFELDKGELVFFKVPGILDRVTTPPPPLLPLGPL
jgi:hypothetical protein